MSLENIKKLDLKIVNLRVLAIILVVLGHSIIIYQSSWNLYSTSVNAPYFDVLKRLIDVIQMPLFFSISGYLFFFKVRYIRFKDLILSRIKRLLVPYFLVACFYMVPIRLLVRYEGYKNLQIYELIFSKILCGYDNGHLWFLPALFLCFVIVYVIVNIENKIPVRSLVKNIINLSLFCYLFYKKPLGYFPYLKNCEDNIMWFYMGYLFNFYSENFCKIRLNKFLKILCAMFALILLFYFNVVDNWLLKVFFRLLILSILYMIISDKHIYGNAIGSMINKNSFGIYLFHSPLIYITYTLIPNSNPIIILLINFGIFGTVGFILTEIFRKIKILKFAIGE